MCDFSKFIKGVRLSCEKENPTRILADAVSQAAAIQKIIHINQERDRLQYECERLMLLQRLYPTKKVSENLRHRQERLSQCEQALHQLGNDVIGDESQVAAVDIGRKRLEEERRKFKGY